MKKIFYGLLALTLLFSCSDDEDEKEIIADFECEITGNAPDASVKITNNTTNAESYEWTFDEGADITSSTDKELTVVFDKAGEHTITLVAISGDSQKELSKTIEIGGYNAVITYEDLEFALDVDDETIGCLFSFDTEKMYKPSEVTDDNAASIHLGFGSMANTIYYFVSPTDDMFDISGVTETQVVNYEETPSISVDDFESITSDSLLSNLSITGTNDSFGNSQIPGTVLFELASGKKGVIKTEAVNSERMLVDIKIQKY